MQIIRIHPTAFELCMREQKKERKSIKSKSEIFMFDFLDCEKVEWKFDGIFYIRIAKGFHL